MRTLSLLALLVVAGPAAAEPPPEPTEVGLLAEIEFGPGSSRLPAASDSRLVAVATWANEHEDGLLVIDGHADMRGPSAGNVLLSMRRARHVRDELLALGVDPSQIITSAFGSESRPRARVAVWGAGAEREVETVAARRSPVRQR